MKMFLMKKDKKAISFNLEPCIGEHIISNVQIINSEICPQCFINNKNEYHQLLLKEWLRARNIPDNRTNLDIAVQSIYGFNPRLFGRMNGWQDFLSLLSHSISGEDDYWINPVQTEYTSMIYLDSRMKTLYCFEPWTYSEVEELWKNRESEIGKILCGDYHQTFDFHTLDLTLNSRLPSRWVKTESGFEIQEFQVKIC